jgi:hypothetical protein
MNASSLDAEPWRVRLSAPEMLALIKWAARAPVSGWGVSDWPNADGAATTIRDCGEFAELAQRLGEGLVACGYAVVSLESLLDENPEPIAAAAATILLTLVGQPIRVFSAPRRLWREVGVDPSRPSNRSRGMGRLPLHIDFVNASNPPEYSCLLCVRPDPGGGGETLVANITDIENDLPPDHLDMLRRPVFSDGVVSGLDNIGLDINPFAVVADGRRCRFRFTGHLLQSTTDIAERRALDAFSDEAEHRTSIFTLLRGDLLILDQRSTLHGRMPLGPQVGVDQDSARLLLLIFLRAYEYEK